MNDNGGMLEVPDEVLESIAGGVLTDADRERIRHTVQTCKECDWSSESVF